MLHGQEIGAIDTAKIVQLHDVGVLKKGGQLRFVDERIHELRLIRQVGKDPFDGDQLFEPFVADDHRPKQFGHAARGDFLEEGVFAELDGKTFVHAVDRRIREKRIQLSSKGSKNLTEKA
jgi:hypothetical protein